MPARATAAHDPHDPGQGRRSRVRWSLLSALAVVAALLAGPPAAQASATGATGGAAGTLAVHRAHPRATHPDQHQGTHHRKHGRHHRRHHAHQAHQAHHAHHRRAGAPATADRSLGARRHQPPGTTRTRTTTSSTTTGTTVLTATTGTGTGTTARTAGPSGVVTSTLGLLAIGNDQPQHLGDVRPYRYVALQHWFGSIVDQIHATSPTTKAVAYFEAAAVRDQDCSTAGYDTHVAYDSAPVNYCWVQRFHPDWFLRDSSGQPLHFADYPEYVAVDVSQPAYRQLWLTNALQLARANHFDGILFDDILIGVSHGLSGRIAGWTDQQYGTAMADFGSWIGDHLRAAGMLGMANAGIDPWVPWEVTAGLRLAAHVDVLNREFTVRWGACGGSYSPLFTDPASAGNPPLSMIEDFQRRAQAAGAAMGSVDYADTLSTSSDVQTMVYGRASFLLTWDGSSPSAYFFRPCTSGDPAAAPWMAEPGLPTGAVQQTGGLLVRMFTDGAVVLNSSTSGHALPASLTRGYTDSTGQATAADESVAPHSALVLLRR